jgi:hypothetical protein
VGGVAAEFFQRHPFGDLLGLRDVGDLLPVFRGRFPERPAQDPCFPFVRAQQAHQQLEGGRLAGAVAADQAVNRAALDP